MIYLNVRIISELIDKMHNRQKCNSHLIMINALREEKVPEPNK